MRRLPVWIVSATLLLALAAPAHADPDTLWRLVHERCVPAAQAGAEPKPCKAVDLGAGTALLKDINGRSQFLLLPTAHITGIEDPAVLRRATPNLFGAAWASRGAMMALAPGVTREQVSLAINAPSGRTQNQLHIHIDCISPAVRAALDARQDRIRRNWLPLGLPLAGHSYQAAWIDGDNLTQNPFKLLAYGYGARRRMGDHSLVVVGAARRGRPGFILLAGTKDLAAGDRASGEELQDHTCGFARP